MFLVLPGQNNFEMPVWIRSLPAGTARICVFLATSLTMGGLHALTLGLMHATVLHYLGLGIAYRVANWSFAVLALTSGFLIPFVILRG